MPVGAASGGPSESQDSPPRSTLDPGLSSETAENTGPVVRAKPSSTPVHHKRRNNNRSNGGMKAMANPRGGTTKTGTSTPVRSTTAVIKENAALTARVAELEAALAASEALLQEVQKSAPMEASLAKESKEKKKAGQDPRRIKEEQAKKRVNGGAVGRKLDVGSKAAPRISGLRRVRSKPQVKRQQGQSQSKSMLAEADRFRATGLLPPSAIAIDLRADRMSIGPKLLALDEAKIELEELAAVEIPRVEVIEFGRVADVLHNHRSRAAFRVAEFEKLVVADEQDLHNAEQHFEEVVRPRATAQIVAAVATGVTKYAAVVDKADVQLPPAAASSSSSPSATRTPAAPAGSLAAASQMSSTTSSSSTPPTISSIPLVSTRSSRDACSAILAELGNVAPLTKDAQVHVVINSTFVDAIVVGPCSKVSQEGQYNLLVFEENTYWLKDYTAGFTRRATFPRSAIYSDGSGQLMQTLPESCFGATSKDGASVDAVKRAQEDPTGPGYALVLLGFGEANKSEFSSILNDISAAAQESVPAPTTTNSTSTTFARKGSLAGPQQEEVEKAQIGSVKTLEAAARKAKYKYKGSYARVGDVLRGTIACKSFIGVRASIVAVFAHAGIEVVRFKDRMHRCFDAPLKSGGYRDILINAKMKSTGMLAEIQITLKSILKIKNAGTKHAFDVTRLVAASNKVEGALTDTALKKIESGLVTYVDVGGAMFPINNERIIPVFSSKTCFLRVLACDAVPNLKGIRLDVLLTDDVLAQIGPTIEELGFNDCGMVGEIPSKLWSTCKNLTEVRMRDNKGLFGDATGRAGASAVAECNRLKVVDFEGNVELDTSELWKGIMMGCRNIEFVSLASTMLSGTIPSKIGKSTALKWLHLGETTLDGSIPKEIGKCTSLEVLWLAKTQISGGIPNELSHCVALEKLGLQHTNISGHILPDIGKCSALKELHLHNTHISGPLPKTIGKCVSLEFLSAFNSKISGTIPLEIGQCIALKEVYLNNSKISGAITSGISKCVQLKYLYLFNTQITGKIPKDIGKCEALEKLDLNNTHITGNIPTEIGNCASLRQLLLSNCKLTGAIPVEALAKCVYLKSIALRGNNLDGAADVNKSALKEALQNQRCSVVC